MTSKIDNLFGSKTRVMLPAKLVLNPDNCFFLDIVSLNVTEQAVKWAEAFVELITENFH